MPEQPQTANSSNPMEAQMADESMVRCLKAQASAIWPLELSAFDRYALEPGDRILDIGCGIGEISSRVACLYPQNQVTGADLIEEHLGQAASRFASLADTLSFQQADALDLPWQDNHFGLSISRHMLHAVPDAGQVLSEMIRVTRPGGYLHLLAEDYGMIFSHPTSLDMDTFWREGAWPFAEQQGADLRSGRKVVSYLKQRGIDELAVHHLQVDNLNTDPGLLKDIFISWRDGHAEPVAAATDMTLAQSTAYFDSLIAALDDDDAYVCWLIPLISARVPGS